MIFSLSAGVVILRLVVSVKDHLIFSFRHTVVSLFIMAAGKYCSNIMLSDYFEIFQKKACRQRQLKRSKEQVASIIIPLDTSVGDQT